MMQPSRWRSINGRNGLAAVDHAPEVDPQLPVDFLQARVLEGPHQRCAGIVEHEVGRSEVAFDFGRVGQHCCAVRDVESV